METTIQNMRPDELASLRLRRLYESRGFRRVRPSKFEEYGLYVDNKNFLQSDRIISFMDTSGKLLALKPDATLSVVKNIHRGTLPTFQKLYYIDEVYRVSRESREYKAQNQIGVELVGPADVFAGIEVVDLALLSLESISESYLLDLSHLGFVTGLFSDLGLSHRIGKQVLAAIRAKSTHEMGALLEQAEVDEQAANRILALSELHGDIAEVLPRARGLITSDEMQSAYDELSVIADALSYNGFSGHLNLDFSVINDLDYYNGIIFYGYVEGIPQGILSGGRYDNLMYKMGKKSGAAGFGVMLDPLATYGKSERRHDFDLVITYGPDSDWSVLLRRVRELTADGASVRLERADADLTAAEFTWKRHCRFEGNRLIEKQDGEDD